MKKLAAIFALLVAALMFFFSEGPLGPILFTDTKYGEIHIKAPVWFASNGKALAYADMACISRHMNVVSKTIKPSTQIRIFNDFALTIYPRQIHIVCSP